jgi:prophage antirepressor-like protein
MNFRNNTNKNFIKISFNGKKHKIKILGTFENPYFCVKDVLNILKYKKITLKKLGFEKNYNLTKIKKKDIFSSDLIRNKNNFNKNFKYNQNIFINKFQIHSLIMKSKVSLKNKFLNLFFKKILPSIRKYGIYIQKEKIKKIQKLLIKELNEKIELQNLLNKNLDETKNLLNKIFLMYFLFGFLFSQLINFYMYLVIF